MREAVFTAFRAGLGRRGNASLFRCPECRTAFEAPAVNPLTRRLARRCPTCREWYPLSGGGPRRSE